ncbi:hypothetical protein AB0L82_37875, partial [Nocardia sp. NPDC052001]|uniref:hypothetical protein n=1 Tax=Nocardia sp. NPDC052001 TaxID=3154853 RepID=UPI003439F01A
IHRGTSSVLPRMTPSGPIGPQSELSEKAGEPHAPTSTPFMMKSPQFEESMMRITSLLAQYI